MRRCHLSERMESFSPNIFFLLMKFDSMPRAAGDISQSSPLISIWLMGSAVASGPEVAAVLVVAVSGTEPVGRLIGLLGVSGQTCENMTMAVKMPAIIKAAILAHRTAR